VTRIADDYRALIAAAVEAVNNLQGKITRIPDGQVEIPQFKIPDEPRAGKQALSKEAVSLTKNVIQQSAATANLNDALEIGYKGFGEIACTEAAKEGISAFLEKRPANFTK
jgi:enoyl-CoA hydratase/3-hydroxyacyl-CoA dehydrogenase